MHDIFSEDCSTLLNHHWINCYINQRPLDCNIVCKSYITYPEQFHASIMQHMVCEAHGDGERERESKEGAPAGALLVVKCTVFPS
jgi:hypothetical protein